jgi:hypothetical protein
LPSAYADCLEILGASASLRSCTGIVLPLPLVVAGNSLFNKFQNKTEKSNIMEEVWLYQNTVTRSGKFLITVKN